MTITRSKGPIGPKVRYQGSAQDRARVVFYQRIDQDADIRELLRQKTSVEAAATERERTVNYGRMDLTFSRTSPTYGTQAGGLPTVTSVSTSNAVGVPDASWSVTLRPGQYFDSDLRNVFLEHDWCDIAFVRNGQEIHVMRGIVDGCSERLTISQNGATIKEYVVYGRNFGKIFRDALVFFDIYTDGFLLPVIATRLFDGGDTSDIGQSPAGTVRTLLFGFLQLLTQQRDQAAASTFPRATILSPNLPGEPDNNFSSEGLFEQRGFTGSPPRRALYQPAQIALGEGSVWNTASAWMDPQMCEIICDLGPVDESSIYLSGPKNQYDIINVSIGQARSRVFFRDIPFPTVARFSFSDRQSLSVEAQKERVLSGPYFTEIPVHTIDEAAIQSSQISRSGEARRNGFLTTGIQSQGTLGVARAGLKPIYDYESIQNYGLRVMNVTSKYFASRPSDFEDLPAIRDKVTTLDGVPIQNVLGTPLEQRDIARDFHAIGHELYSGTINLSPGRADIRAGSRVRILRELEDDVSYYVDEVQHSLVAGAALLTTLRVSRGFVGTDEELAERVIEIANRYSEPDLAAPANPISYTPANLTYPSSAALSDYTAVAVGVRFIPGSEEFFDLFENARSLAGTLGPNPGPIPSSWVRSPALVELIRKESGGVVGIPNGYAGRSIQDMEAQIARIKAGKVAGGLNGALSSAVGLGQFIQSTLKEYYPNGNNDIGVPLVEAAATLAYIRQRYGSPNAAIAKHRRDKSY